MLRYRTSYKQLHIEYILVMCWHLH